MKRKIKKDDYRFLKKEFHYLEESGLLEQNQSATLLDLYEPTEKINFIQTILLVGAILIGAGVLSFIAGNWQVMPKLLKFLLIFGSTIGLYVGGYRLETSYPKTSRSLYYIGIFVFGAGIFLIGQMFHLSGNAYAAFLLWGIGVLPLAYYLKDKFMTALTVILFIIYAFETFSPTGNFPFVLFLLIPLLHWMNATGLNHSKGLFLFNTLLAITLLFNILYYIEAKLWIGALIFFIFGIFLTFIPSKHYTEPAKWIGAVIYGVSGIMLSFPSVWENMTSGQEGVVPATIFTIIFIAILVYFLKIGSLPAILVSCAFIFRFYADISYDFMPKSLFFIFGGVILIGFGFWFEKSRRAGEDE